VSLSKVKSALARFKEEHGEPACVILSPRTRKGEAEAFARTWAKTLEVDVITVDEDEPRLGCSFQRYYHRQLLGLATHALVFQRVGDKTTQRFALKAKERGLDVTVVNL
jgi:hypothetical protein